MEREERIAVTDALARAVGQLVEAMDVRLIPDAGTSIVYALPDAREPGDVAAVAGRIVRHGDTVHPGAGIAFGASTHAARIVLTAMKFDPDIRSTATIRFSDAIIAELDNLMFEICSFDRAKEPPGVRTMDWGVASCCGDGVPDVIYDRGAPGKEPVIRILAEDPEAVAHNIIKLSTRITYARL